MKTGTPNLDIFLPMLSILFYRLGDAVLSSTASIMKQIGQ